jgi:parallel beta-helix repeat protein
MRLVRPATAALLAVPLAGCLVTIDRDKIPGSGDAPPPCLDDDPANTVVCPGESIQAAVDANTTDTEFTIKAGVHRLQTVVPKGGNVFNGEDGAVLSGAIVLTQFQKDGALWFVDGQTQGGTEGEGACYTGTGNEAGLFKNWPRCRYLEDLYFDDVPLRHVASLSEVSSGTWFFDYVADRIYFADDPSGHKVETSVAPGAFHGVTVGGDHVTIRGLIIEKYASEGAIHFTNHEGWLIENNEIRLNHGGAVVTATEPSTIIRGNHLHNNGSGVEMFEPRAATVENNEIAYNANTDGWPGYTAVYRMGMHVIGSTDLIVRLNHVHDNGGHGIRLTGGNANYAVTQNTVERNQYHGVMLHTSCGGEASANEVHNNGLGGITLDRTEGAELFSNKLSGNGSGFFGANHSWATPYQIVLYETAGTPCTPIANVSIHDNTFVIGNAVGAVDVAVTTGFVFATNTYDLKAASATPFRIADALKTELEWQAAGYDPDGVFLR